MAFRTIQIDLQFNANTSRAKQQMQELQTQLNQLATSQPTSQLSLTPQLQSAQQAAMQLKIALNNAVNTDTGRLNLNKFQAQLNQSGMSLKTLAAQMQALGPAGVQAFSSMTSMIAQADTRMFSLTGKAKSFITSISHSAQYQLASTLIYGTINSFKETLDYAQKLDTSLNNIRIVTGKGADEMARFAKEANAMAKELSTSTTKYTDASLIYYQQGLGDKEVKERTDVTIKLANVVGEEASTVSDWMTAIWNNFDDGTETLEYYADVLTKLGASTASSADEIADGLEKFAAVADTVGLSYEYATSALATITAETRQSADVVGTALKTLFARMEGLKLGETLEDGTTLNQYSLALEKVGVSIKDANGELKDMDTILDDTGARWDTLAKDEQVALAQSVAGIRQYTQFMALMDNWDVMENNLQLTEEATGALEEQQAIYEESTVAAKERMTAAAEEFKTLIVGGEDLSKVYDLAGGFLEIINDVFKATGGLKTILLGVAAALLKMYQPQVATMFSNLAVSAKDAWAHMKNFATNKGWVGNGQAFQVEATQLANQMINKQASNTEGGMNFTQQSSEMDMLRVQQAGKLSEADKQIADWEIQIIKAQQEQIKNNTTKIQQAKELNAAKSKELEKSLDSITALGSVTKTAEKVGAAEARGAYGLNMLQQADQSGGLNEQGRQDLGAAMTSNLSTMKNQLSEVDIEIDKLSFDQVEQSLQNYIQSGEGLDTLIGKMKQLNEEVTKAGNSAMAHAGVETRLRSANSTYDQLSSAAGISETTSIKSTAGALNKIDLRSKDLSKSDKEEIKALRNRAKELQKSEKLVKSGKKSQESYNKELKEFNNRVKNTTTRMSKQNSQFRKNIKQTDKYKNVTKKSGKEIKDQGKNMRENAKDAETNSIAVDGLTKKTDSFLAKLKSGKLTAENFSTTLTKGISWLASYAMGLSMVTSAAEQMGHTFASGDHSLSGWISNISSMAMGIMMLLPLFSKWSSSLKNIIIQKQQSNAVTKAMNALTKLEISQENAEMLLNKKKTAEEVAGNQAEAASEIVTAYAKNAKNAAEGPTGWAKFAAGLAMIAPIAAMVGMSVISGASGAAQGEEEKKQEAIDESKENLEAIDENQELATSVSDLTKEYKDLRETGQSTAEVLESMREKIPDLIDSYKELAKTLGLDIDISSLEEGYKIFEQTGDITKFEEAQAEVDEKVASAEKSEAKSLIKNAKDLALESASNGIGDGFWGDEYRTDVGSIDDSEDKEMFEEVFGDYYDEDKQAITFDSNNAGEVVDAYNRMLQARAKLEETHTDEELEDLEYYNKLNEEIKELSKNMPDVIEGQQKLYEIEKEEALADQTNFNNEVFGTLDDKITDVETYANVRQKLINKLVEEKQWTEAQAEAYLKSSEAFGRFEDTIDQFGEEVDVTQFATDNLEEIQKIKDWFAKLPPEERTLAMNIDYTLVGDLADAKAALEEQRELMRIANAKKEATDLGIEEGAFEMHKQLLQNYNKELSENEALAAEVAAANYKLNKGLKTLQDSWDDNLEVLQNANVLTPEYAEALGEVHDALEEAFGASLSAEFIQNHLEEIGRLARGDTEGIQELRDAMAEDVILNMDIEPFSTNGEAAVAVEEGKQALYDMLDSIDTSLELGEGTTLSGDFLNTVQAMLDSGQMTEAQLQEMMTAKGYQLEISGWKEVDGPKKTITQSITNWLGITTTRTITEQEKIQVPIINGEGDAITGTAAPAIATKISDESSVNFSQTDDSGELGETSAEKKKRLRDLDDEIERYHEIDEIIQDIERDLSSLSTAKDRAFGAKKIKLINEEIAAQKKLLKAEKNRQKEAEDWYKKDREYILDNYAVKLDKEGNITNYNDLIRQETNKLKAMDPDSDAYKDQKTYLSTMKEDFAQYEETLDEVKEAQESVIEQQNALQDLAMEKIEYKIQMKIDMADDDRKLAEFLMSKYEDDDFATAEKVQGYTDTTKADMKAWNANQKGIEKVQKDLAAGKISEEDAIAKLRELRDEQISLVEGMEETRASVFESLSTMFDAWNEKFDTQIAKIEHLKNVTQSYKNIVDIVGKDNLGISDETMKKFNQVNVQASQEQMYAARKKKEENEKYLADLQKARADAEANGQDTSYWDDLIEDAEEKVRESTEEFMSSWEEALQAAADAFAANVEQIAENFSEGVSGIYKNLDELEAAFERQTTLSELYLKNYEKSYEISKLNRSIQDSIDKTDNIGSQKELRDLQRELLEMNKEGTKVSKYDIEYMQKKYDLMVAEQALKDAQNAKSTVRLRRDSEGNYGYVYTADQDIVGKAEQNYEDKLYAMQQFGDNLVLEAQKQYIALNQAYKDAMLEISQDMTLNDEEKKAKMAEITRYYQDQMQYWADQSNSIMLRGTEINAQYGTQMATSFHDTILGQMFPDINSFDQLYGQSIISMNGSTESFNGAVDELGRTVNNIMSDAGYDVEDFADNVDNYLGDAQEDLADTREESNELAAAMEEDMSAGVSAVENFESEYANKMESIRSETQKTINKINKLIKRLNALDKAKDSANDDDDEDYTGTGDPPGGGTTKKPTTVKPTTKPTTVKPTTKPKTKKDPFIVGATFNTKKFPGNIATYGQAIQYSDGSWGNLRSEGTNIDFTRTGDPTTGEEFKIYGTTIQDGVTYLAIGRTDGSGWAGTTDINTLSFVGSPVTRWVKKSTLKNLYTGYDTGGYTGEWGPEGRMAMLHQKEIVLNAHDTENFLAAIGIVRDINDQIEKNAMAMQYINQLRGYGATINPSNGTLQQDITIHAEFPNATNHSEIEEAFRNLGNLASQYANRKS